MANTTRSPSRAGDPRRATPRASRPRAAAEPRESLQTGLRLPGGTEGNERLTILAGVLLILVFAVVGITILRIHQLLWLHLFVGITVIGPVALKMASTGYRFTLYYLGEQRYRRKGPPPTMLRMLAPVLVLSSVGVLATGVGLLFIGRNYGSPVLLLHKGFFIVWIGVCGIHVLAHLPEVLHSRAPARRTRSEVFATAGGASSLARSEAAAAGRARGAALVVSLLGGLVLALALSGTFHVWTG
ncbi:MAG TPA: hypothetical protein VFN65_12890 [Solirubrobacteraceae bacterium]|nr:hypothetical protein [Solirubrobacteraceae bacterium]